MRTMTKHLEHELRYLRPKGFYVPDGIVGLPYLGSQEDEHLDVYYEAWRKGRPLLEAARVNFRVRILPNGAFATVKIKRRARGCVTVREEHTFPMPDPEILDADNPVVGMAHDIVGQADLREHLRIRTCRTDHHYLTREGAHLVLSEDSSTFADGTDQRRVEIEIAHGDVCLLKAADEEMRRRFSDLKLASRGKYSEAKRRHARSNRHGRALTTRCSTSGR